MNAFLGIEDADLSELPFEVLQKIESTIGTKRFKEVLLNTDAEAGSLATQGVLGAKVGMMRNEDKILAKHASKHAPVEMSSRIRVPEVRKVVAKTLAVNLIVRRAIQKMKILESQKQIDPRMARRRVKSSPRPAPNLIPRPAPQPPAAV